MPVTKKKITATTGMKMKSRRVMDFEVLLEPSVDGGYAVHVPALRGCHTQGETLKECLENAKDAIQSYLEVKKSIGRGGPSNGTAKKTITNQKTSLRKLNGVREGRTQYSAPRKTDPFDKLYVGSSQRMDQIPDESISLTITSPPYWNAIDYDVHSLNPEATYRTRDYKQGFQGYDTYLEFLGSIFEETLKKTKPGGFLAIVIGTVLFKGRHIPVPMDVTHNLVSKGWEFFQDIIWHKTTAGVKRAGVVIQHPYPGYYRPNIMTEYILIFRKPGDPIYLDKNSEIRKSAEIPINRVFTNEIANNIWHIAPVPPRTLEHPCPFPEEIPYRLIKLLSYPGDVVLDPFLGSGQTSKVAHILGRKYVGYDIFEKYVKYSLQRLKEPLRVRELQLIAEFTKIPIDTQRMGLKRKNGRTRHGSGLQSEHKASVKRQNFELALF